MSSRAIGRARAVATAAATSAGVARLGRSAAQAIASAATHARGTSFGFRPDQAMACRQLRRSARRRRGVAQPRGQELLDRRRLGEPAELSLQLGPLGGREVGPVQPLAQDARQLARPTRGAGRRSTRPSPSASRSVEASSPATNFGSSPPPSIWSSATIAARRVARRFELASPAGRRLAGRRSRSGHR